MSLELVSCATIAWRPGKTRLRKSFRFFIAPRNGKIRLKKISKPIRFSLTFWRRKFFDNAFRIALVILLNLWRHACFSFVILFRAFSRF